MKKILSLLIAGIFVLLGAACGKRNPDEYFVMRYALKPISSVKNEFYILEEPIKCEVPHGKAEVRYCYYANDTLGVVILLETDKPEEMRENADDPEWGLYSSVKVNRKKPELKSYSCNEIQPIESSANNKALFEFITEYPCKVKIIKKPVEVTFDSVTLEIPLTFKTGYPASSIEGMEALSGVTAE